MTTKGKLVALACACFLAAAPGVAQGAAGPANPLVGVWQLSDLSVQNQKGKHIFQIPCPLGEKPTGMLICLPSGTYTMQILRDPPSVQRTPGILPYASDKEKLDLATGFYTESGSYSIPAGSTEVHFQVLASCWPGMANQDWTCKYNAHENSLEFLQLVMGYSGAMPTRRYEWKRMDPGLKGQAYSLVSVEVLTPDGKPDPEQGKWMGVHPTGQLIDLPAGYYALNATADPPPQRVAGQLLPDAKKDEQLAAILANYGEFGTYTYDAASAVTTTHILGALWPNLRGHDLTVHRQVDGDRLISTTDPIDAGKGKSLVYRWTWEAAK